MARGISIHVGLNRVSPHAYGGWAGELAACEADARAMRDIADRQGFGSVMMLGSAATSEALAGVMLEAARQLKAGDMLLVTYAGHGGQIRDPSGEAVDETWVLYDRQFVDDELYALLARLAPGVRAFVVSDGGQSDDGAHARFYGPLLVSEPSPDAKFRVMPPEVGRRAHEMHKATYDDLQQRHALGHRVAIAASVILMSCCQRNQLSLDGPDHGLFTGKLLETWGGGRFRGDYPAFYRAIFAAMPPGQTPGYSTCGERDVCFERERPFTI